MEQRANRIAHRRANHPQRTERMPLRVLILCMAFNNICLSSNLSYSKMPTSIETEYDPLSKALTMFSIYKNIN